MVKVSGLKAALNIGKADYSASENYRLRFMFIKRYRLLVPRELCGMD